MRILLFMALISLSAFSKAKAADACFTGINIKTAYHSDQAFENLVQADLSAQRVAYLCKDVNIVSTGLKATALIVQAGAMSTACSIGGIPIAVVLQGAAIGIGAADLYVSNLNCVDDEEKTELKKQVNEAVCSTLSAQGIECDQDLQIEDGMSL